MSPQDDPSTLGDRGLMGGHPPTVVLDPPSETRSGWVSWGLVYLFSFLGGITLHVARCHWLISGIWAGQDVMVAFKHIFRHSCKQVVAGAPRGGCSPRNRC